MLPLVAKAFESLRRHFFVINQVSQQRKKALDDFRILKLEYFSIPKPHLIVKPFLDMPEFNFCRILCQA